MEKKGRKNNNQSSELRTILKLRFGGKTKFCKSPLSTFSPLKKTRERALLGEREKKAGGDRKRWRKRREAISTSPYTCRMRSWRMRTPYIRLGGRVLWFVALSWPFIYSNIITAVHVFIGQRVQPCPISPPVMWAYVVCQIWNYFIHSLIIINNNNNN